MCILSNKNAFNPQLLKAAAGIFFPREDSLKKANEISRFLRDHVRLVWIVSGVFHTVQLRKVQFVHYVC